MVFTVRRSSCLHPWSSLSMRWKMAFSLAENDCLQRSSGRGTDRRLLDFGTKYSPAPNSKPRDDINWQQLLISCLHDIYLDGRPVVTHIQRISRFRISRVNIESIHWLGNKAVEPTISKSLRINVSFRICVSEKFRVLSCLESHITCFQPRLSS